MSVLETAIAGHPDLPEGSMLMGYVTAIDILLPDGDRQVFVISGPELGPKGTGLTYWGARGLLAEAAEAYAHAGSWASSVR